MLIDSSLAAHTVKNLPPMWEIWVRSLGREDPLEKEMATHSSTLAWKSPWTEEPGRLQSMGSLESDTTERLHTVTLPRFSQFSSVEFSHSVVSDSSDPMDCSPPGSSIHGIFQARVLEWGAIAFSSSSSTLTLSLSPFPPFSLPAFLPLSYCATISIRKSIFSCFR